MQTPLATSIALAADALAKPLGLQQQDIESALSVPSMAKAQCTNCTRHGCPLNLNISTQTIRNRSRSRSRSSDESTAGNRSRSRSTERQEASFVVLCDVCCPNGEGVQLRRHATR